MKKLFLFYGLLIVALLMLFQLSQYWLFKTPYHSEIFISLVAITSIVIGIYFGKGKNNPPSLTPVHLELNLNMIKKLQISQREMEVLELISQGLSNKEIGETLFVSESTIKTHVSNLLVKLDSKRRTQAVSKAKELNIIA